VRPILPHRPRPFGSRKHGSPQGKYSVVPRGSLANGAEAPSLAANHHGGALLVESSGHFLPGNSPGPVFRQKGSNSMTAGATALGR
jgi:hypothetical protein